MKKRMSLCGRKEQSQSNIRKRKLLQIAIVRLSLYEKVVQDEIITDLYGNESGGGE